MGTKWTQEQQQVIDLRDCNMLVSAAAGSGKTAVLVERIISRIMDEKKPVDIDRLLVVTFTNAAAAEMRERIRQALEAKLEEKPDNIHLQRQVTLIHHAQITTIHSFCLEVIRNHFHVIGIDPGFRVGDEGELKLLRHDVMEKLLEEEYQKGEADFLLFSEAFAPGRTDQELEGLILQLYDFSMGYPWPKQWRRDCENAYVPGTEEKFYHAEWMKYLLEKLNLQILDMEEQLQLALECAMEQDGPYPYADALEQDLERLKRLGRCRDYREYADAFAYAGSWPALSRKKDVNISEQKKIFVKELRDQVKKNLKKLEEDYFFTTPWQMMEDMRQSRPMVQVLLRLADRFQEAFENRKAEENMVDFNDLEHLALRILVREEDGQWQGTPVAEEYAHRYEEIMIDEYQDSNLVQEILLNSVSGKPQGRHNVFMVGDVKQSIYRFRLARPELFMEKYHTYKKDSGADRRIDLHKNFRSRSQVLDGVNLIFRQIMTETLGGVEYDAQAALYPGAVFEEGASQEFLEPEVLLVAQEPEKNKNENDSRNVPVPEILDEEEAELDARQREAVAAALRIKKIVGQELVWDKEKACYRTARYSDIVVLLRTVTGWAEQFAEVFTDMGIPAHTGASTGYFSTLEVRTVLAYLRVLDNPRQDIPLAAVLRSPMGKLSDEELAKLRILSPDTDFYSCCMAYLERQPEDREEPLFRKLECFWQQTERMRRLVPYTPMHLLLWKLLDVTGYGNYVTAMPGGAQRKANLDMLVEKAVSYESTSYRGLFNFIRYVEHLQKYEIDYGEASLTGETEDNVRIMSIHKSKGLEFPIVMVCGMGKNFNQQDARSRLALHPILGIGCDYVELDKRIKLPLLLKRVIARQTQEENLGEELRVLYVAMTRAKEKLILMGTVKKTEEKLVQWSREGRRCGEKLSYSCLGQAGNYLDWVMPALLRHPSSGALRAEYELPEPVTTAVTEAPGSFRIIILSDAQYREERRHQQAEATLELKELREICRETVYDETVRERFEKLQKEHYPYEANRVIPGKMTVSELKKMGNGIPYEETLALLEEPVIVPLLPRFCKQEEQPGGADRGTMYHRFMEHLDFAGDFAGNFMEMQLESMVKCGKILKDEAKWIRPEKIEAFLGGRLAGRMQRAARAGELHREQPFVLGVTAGRIRKEWNFDEEILVQGIIDAWFLEEDEIVLIDYKTDRIAFGEETRLVERYRAQLEYYQMALERLTGKKVKEKIIYSFCLNEEIPVA